MNTISAVKILLTTDNYKKSTVAFKSSIFNFNENRKKIPELMAKRMAMKNFKIYVQSIFYYFL